jgi:membrane protein required for beta-lactamase induction
LTLNLKKNKYKYVDIYAAKMRPLLAKMNIDRAMPAFIGLLIPALVVIGLLNLILGNIFYFIYALIVFYLCLDFRDVRKQIGDYQTAVAGENLTQAQFEAEQFVEHPVHQNKGEMSRAVTETIFIKSLTNVFAIIFWFMVLGPFGAVLYYLTAAITQRAQRPEFGFSDTYSSAEYFKQILDWLPVRFVTLTFAVVGHFTPVFGIWLDRISSGLLENRQLLIDAGLTAVHADLDASHASLTENNSTLQLVTRTLWAWIIVIAVFTVITWL